MSDMKYVGVILAGGQSRRFGSPKMFATLNGTFYYELVYECLKPSCDKVIIVTNDHLLNRFPKKYDVITDVQAFSGFGPLAGIYSSMVMKNAAHYIVLPCDMPLITNEVIEKLVSYHSEDVTAIEIDGEIQPLVSIWNQTVKEKLFHYLQNGHRHVKQFIESINKTIVTSEMLHVPTHIFKNVNTPQDGEELKKWINW